ncbi:response regulator [Mariprofundus sp. EBB-1]|uniref:response regulator n=1 Tax=Mariprofundus sp. EBB-1 TaxID=2650971 RepID=UPI000EF18511|nr:response regulator [Mariprofundus sp. EBB-1]RLL53021.1 response regulator [Mariprofundus sp. EBB-1]
MEKPRLLLAEDDEALASLLEEYLSEAGYDLVVHHRGDSALQALQEEHFDLVLSDIVMPGADGLTLLRHIHEHMPDTLIMLMTGYSGIENALHAVEQGAYDFVSKPFQLPEIRVRLDNAARYQRLLARYKLLNGETVKPVEAVQPGGDMVVRAYGQNKVGNH